MPIRKSYKIAGVVFENKKQIKEYIRQYINLSPLGSTVEDPVLIELLHKHPEWSHKSAGMIRLAIGFMHVKHANVSMKGVLIERQDGFMDITWSRLVDRLQVDGSLRRVNDRSENLFKIKKAARSAIQSQILAIHSEPGLHVDHIYPRTFDRLLFLFLKWWSVPINEIKIIDEAGSIINHRFECWELTDSWFEFHYRIARLRAVSAEINMAAPVYPVNWDSLP